MGNAFTISAIYINSYHAVIRFRSLVSRYGYEEVIRNKIERERIIAALFFIGLTTDTKKEYYLRVTELGDTDAIGASYEIGSDGRRRESLYNLEILEFEEHSTISLLEQFKKKIKKSYLSYFSLVCYINLEMQLNPEDLYQYFQQFKPPFSDIWILGNNIQENKHVLTKLYPYRFQTSFFLEEQLKKQTENDFIKTWRGSGNKMENLGLYHLPLGK